MSETLRERVIAAAVACIAESGPDSLSFRQIAAEAGVSHQAPYHHFRDRDGVFAEIALQGFRLFTDGMRAAPRPGEAPDVPTRLCERYVDFAVQHKGYFRVMFRSDLCRMSSSPDLLEAADAAFDTLLDAVNDVVGESASLDEVRLMATTMWSVSHGIATLLVDGPLESKLGQVDDRRMLVRAVARQLRVGFTLQ